MSAEFLFECDGENCTDGGEYVDIYHHDWCALAPVPGYLPEGWKVTDPGTNGLVQVLCEHCSAGES